MTAMLPEAVRGAKTPIEVWHQDDARVGQQGTLTYVWADKGSRPDALRDQRRQSAYRRRGSAAPGFHPGECLRWQWALFESSAGLLRHVVASDVTRSQLLGQKKLWGRPGRRHHPASRHERSA